MFHFLVETFWNAPNRCTNNCYSDVFPFHISLTSDRDKEANVHEDKSTMAAAQDQGRCYCGL